MADRITITINPNDARQIRIRLQQLGQAGTQEVEQSVKEETEGLKDKIKSRCPYRTGKLRDSIDIKKLKASDKVVRYQIKQDSKKAWYGKIVELGSSRRKGKFFMKRTYQQNKQKMADKIKNNVKRRLGL